MLRRPKNCGQFGCVRNLWLANLGQNSLFAVSQRTRSAIKFEWLPWELRFRRSRTQHNLGGVTFRERRPDLKDSCYLCTSRPYGPSSSARSGGQHVWPLVVATPWTSPNLLGLPLLSPKHCRCGTSKSRLVIACVIFSSKMALNSTDLWWLTAF